MGGQSTAAVLLAVLCLHALSARARSSPRLGTAMGDACACDGQDSGLRLLRGQDELADCEAGFHCDCASETVLQCDDMIGMQMQLDETSQMCDFHVDCAAQLEPKPATTEEPPTTPAETSCTCSLKDRPQQLIHGRDQQAKCEAGEYCDCASRAVMHCGGPMERFDETSQTCEVLLNCEEALTPSTPSTPSDASSVTATAATAEASTVTLAPQCTCDPKGPAQQLLRGADQLQSCDAGTYCHCSSRQLQSCAVSSLLVGIVFNEEEQSCVYDSDFCRAFFDPEPKTQPTAAPSPAPSGGTTPSRTGRCVCERGGHELQLMRGPSGTADCVQGYYCDCLAQSVRRCESYLNTDWKFDEDEQECKYDFDCQSFLDKHPAVPGDNNGGGASSSSSAGALVDWAGSTHIVGYRFVIVSLMVIVANVGVIYTVQYYCRLRGYPTLPSPLTRCRRAQGADALPEKSVGGESRA